MTVDAPCRVRGVALLLTATWLTACIQVSDVQEERIAFVAADVPCPARDAPKTFAPTLRDDEPAGVLISVDEGPVEGPARTVELEDGTTKQVKGCVYLVTVRYRTGG